MKLNFNIDPEKVKADRKARLAKLIDLNVENCTDDQDLWQKLARDVQDLSDVEDLEGFNTRLYCYVHYMALNNTPTTLYRMNRIFNLNSKFRVRDAINSLVSEGLLAQIPNGSRSVILTKSYLDFINEVYEGDPTGKADFMSSLLARAT